MDSKKEHDHRDELSSVDIGCPLSTRPFIEWHTQQNKSEPKFKKKKEREKKTKPNQTKPNDENETGKWKDDEKHGWVRLGPTFRCVCVCVSVCECVSVWVCVRQFPFRLKVYRWSPLLAAEKATAIGLAGNGTKLTSKKTEDEQKFLVLLFCFCFVFYFDSFLFLFVVSFFRRKQSNFTAKKKRIINQ